MFLCIVKLVLVNLIIFLFRKCKFCFVQVFYGVNIKNLNIFCYQAVTSAPVLIIPIAVMMSCQSNSASINIY